MADESNPKTKTVEKKYKALVLSDGITVFSRSTDIDRSTYKCEEGVEIVDQVTFDSDSETEDLLYNDGFRHLTKEESDRFCQQIEDSGGFDVDVLEQKVIVSFYRVRDQYLQKYYSDYEEFAEFAISKHNEDSGRRLELVKVTKVCEDMGTRISYYLTFDAKEKGVDGTYTTGTYQAQVWDQLKSNKQLMLFRAAPQNSLESST